VTGPRRCDGLAWLRERVLNLAAFPHASTSPGMLVPRLDAVDSGAGRQRTAGLNGPEAYLLLGHRVTAHGGELGQGAARLAVDLGVSL